MSVETTLELAKIDNIVAIKEASGNMEQIMELVHKRPEGFGVLSGDDGIVVPLISVGVDGVISVVANAFPKKFSEMVKQARQGDFSAAKKLHYDLMLSTNQFFAEGNPGISPGGIDPLQRTMKSLTISSGVILFSSKIFEMRYL